MSQVPLAGGAIDISTADEQTIVADGGGQTAGQVTTAVTTETTRATTAEGTLTTAVATKVTLVTAPGTATSTGVAGSIAYDATHIYVCVATNTWVRATLATF